GEVDQDRGQGGEALQVCPLPVGGSRRPEKAVRPDPGADRPVVPGLCLGLRLGRSGNRVRKPSPGVRGAQRGAISRSTWRRRGGCGDSGAGSNAVRSSSGWEIRCSGPFAGARWASRIENVVPEGVYLGKIGLWTPSQPP